MKLFKEAGFYGLFNVNRSALKSNAKAVLLRMIEIYEAGDTMDQSFISSYSYIGELIYMDRQAVARATKELIDERLISLEINQSAGNLSRFTFTQELLARFDLGTGKYTKNAKKTLPPHIKNDMTPHIKNDMTPHIKNDMTPHIKNDMTPHIKNDHNIDDYIDDYLEDSLFDRSVMRACVSEDFFIKTASGLEWNKRLLPCEDGFEKQASHGEHYRRDEKNNRIVSDNGIKNRKLRMCQPVCDTYLTLDASILSYNQRSMSLLYQHIAHMKNNAKSPHFLIIKENALKSSLGYLIHKALHFAGDSLVMIDSWENIVNQELRFWQDSRNKRSSDARPFADRSKVYDLAIIVDFLPKARDVQSQVLRDLVAHDKPIIFITTAIDEKAFEFRGDNFLKAFQDKTTLIELS
jgi:hypothetical protein